MNNWQCSKTEISAEEYKAHPPEASLIFGRMIGAESILLSVLFMFASRAATTRSRWTLRDVLAPSIRRMGGGQGGARPGHHLLRERTPAELN